MKFFSTLTAVVLFLLASVVSADLDHNPEGAGWTELVADAEGNCYLQFTDWGTEGFKCNVRTERIGIVDHATYTCKSIDGARESPAVPSCNSNVETYIFSGEGWGGFRRKGLINGWEPVFPLGVQIGCRTYHRTFISVEEPPMIWAQRGCDMDPSIVEDEGVEWYDRQW